jgi:hypothetical protein
LGQKGGDSPDRRSVWAFQLPQIRFQKILWSKGEAAPGLGRGRNRITPFLAWVQSLSEHEAVHIYLFYSALNAEEAFGQEVLEKEKARLHDFSLDVVFSQSEGRVDADRLIASAPSP